jgi:peroxiredoxin
MHTPPAVSRFALASLVALLACSGPTLAELAVGQPAPAFTLLDLDGHEVSLAALRGKTVVLEWINPNCPISRGHAERHTMIDTAARHPEAVWLAINSTNPTHPDHVDRATHKSYDAKHGITYPVLEDPKGEVGRAYGAKTTPHMFVIDATGTVAYAGAIDDGGRGSAKLNYVDSALAALAAGRRPDPAATRPYGCSVKY